MSATRILVVDDEPVVCAGCKKILGEAGYLVTTAFTAHQALDVLDRESFEVVITDLKMPGMNGIELLTALREKKPAIKVIVITGYATVETAVEAMKLGAFDYLPKPFTGGQVTAVVRRALEQIRQEAEAENQRREREKKLIEVANEMQRIKTVVNAMASGVLVVDRGNRVVMSNPAANQMLGVTDAQLIGKVVTQYIKEDKIRQLVYESEDTHISGLSGLSLEFNLGDGKTTKCIRARATPVRSLVGKLLGSVIVLEDITSLKEQDRRKTDFLEIAAHELRAPLAAIAQQLMVVRDGLAGEMTEKQREIISRIKERSDGLLTLTSNLLELTKVEEGNVTLAREVLNVNEVLLKVVDLFSAQMEARHLTVRFQGDQVPPLVDADLGYLERVFVNLLSNAIKYTPEGGIIIVGTSVESEWVKVTIADTGIGIPPEEREKIFEKFYRVPCEGTRKVVGAGIGLSLVRKIVELHGGKIEVESSLGEGSTFIVSLPRRRQDLLVGKGEHPGFNRFEP